MNAITYILLYGDLNETPLKVLGEHCPSETKYNSFDEEQKLRLHAAATVQEYFNKNEGK